VSVPARPCIAISRQPGSGAAELGQRAAEELHYGFFGIEIVDWIARTTGYRRQLIAGVDERIRSAIERSVSDNFRRKTFTETDYLQYVVRTVVAFSEQGGAVMLGRGAPFIVDPERALRVLVVASRSLRGERLAKRHSLTPSEADTRLSRHEAQPRGPGPTRFPRSPFPTRSRRPGPLRPDAQLGFAIDGSRNRLVGQHASRPLSNQEHESRTNLIGVTARIPPGRDAAHVLR